MRLLKKIRWPVLLGAGLILLSAVLYYIHYLIFRDAHHIFIYMLGDLAFLPIEVLLVTLIIEKLLKDRERKAVIEKMNMVIGAFFSEVGMPLLRFYKECCIKDDIAIDFLRINTDWNDGYFDKAAKAIKGFNFRFNNIKRDDFVKLKDFLRKYQSFLLGLLENPNLLEHDKFTELLWAAFHLNEELQARTDVLSIPDSDFKHLIGDLQRVYSYLFLEWIEYMRHLKRNYPFLYSFAVRTNPFNPESNVEV